MHSIHQPSPSQSVLVRSSLCIPPTGNPPLQSVRVCPTSASAPTVHCVSELVLSSSTPVNENHFCSPHNRQPDRNQCLWIPWCVDHLKRCKTSNLLDDVLQWFSNLTSPFWLFHLISQQQQGGKAFSDYLAQRSYVTEGEATGDAQLCTCR